MNWAVGLNGKERDMHIYNLVFDNSKETIIWEVERNMSITLKGITRTLKFRVPEYNLLVSLSLSHF